MAVAAPSDTELFRLTDVARLYGSGTTEVRALDGVSLSINAGDFMAIIGPNGSGKSTLLGLLGCLDLPTMGSIEVGGREVTLMEDAERSRLRGDAIGFVFQQFHLLHGYTALDNVADGALDAGQSLRGPRELARIALDRVGLSHRVDHDANKLSGGERQRVAIARTLLLKPKLILADEPTGNLDTVTGSRVIDLLFELNAEFGTTLVLVTHDERLAGRCSRSVEIAAGRLLNPDLQPDQQGQPS